MLARLYASSSGEPGHTWRLIDFTAGSRQGEREHWARKSFEGRLGHEGPGHTEG